MALWPTSSLRTGTGSGACQDRQVIRRQQHPINKLKNDAGDSGVASFVGKVSQGRSRVALVMSRMRRHRCARADVAYPEPPTGIDRAAGKQRRHMAAAIDGGHMKGIAQAVEAEGAASDRTWPP